MAGGERETWESARAWVREEEVRESKEVNWSMGKGVLVGGKLGD